MRLLKRRSQRLVACVFCTDGWRYEGPMIAFNETFPKYVRCSVCGGSGDFVSRRDTQ